MIMAFFFVLVFFAGVFAGAVFICFVCPLWLAEEIDQADISETDKQFIRFVLHV